MQFWSQMFCNLLSVQNSAKHQPRFFESAPSLAVLPYPALPPCHSVRSGAPLLRITLRTLRLLSSHLPLPASAPFPPPEPLQRAFEGVSHSTLAAIGVYFAPNYLWHPLCRLQGLYALLVCTGSFRMQSCSDKKQAVCANLSNEISLRFAVNPLKIVMARVSPWQSCIIWTHHLFLKGSIKI